MLLNTARWKTANGSHLLLKLAGHMCIDCEVPGIVWARCDFIDQHSAVPGHKQFHTGNANDIELLKQSLSNLDRPGFDTWLQRSGADRHIKNMIRMCVTKRSIKSGLATRIA